MALLKAVHSRSRAHHSDKYRTGFFQEISPTASTGLFIAKTGVLHTGAEYRVLECCADTGRFAYRPQRDRYKGQTVVLRASRYFHRRQAYRALQRRRHTDRNVGREHSIQLLARRIHRRSAAQTASGHTYSTDEHYGIPFVHIEHPSPCRAVTGSRSRKQQQQDILSRTICL